MLARGSSPLLFLPALLMVVVLALVLIFERMAIVFWTLPLGALFLLFLWFFRDPDRAPGEGIVSPADGRVLAVDRESQTLSVFLSLFDVHVVRAPLSGVVSQIERSSGGHATAYSPEAEGNAHVTTWFDTGIGTVILRQYVGFIARRILPYVREGDSVKRGQRIGLIRFGSRVDLTLPANARLVVRKGDRVRAGETTVAVIDRA